MRTEQQDLPPADRVGGHDVFVSYSRADRDVVTSLIQGLADRGKRAWVDLEDIPPSAEWMAEIRAAIESADGYLVVISPDLARSHVCATEFEHAHASGKRIVPLQVRTTDPGSVPAGLAALNWIDATNGAGVDVLDDVVRALDTDLDLTRGHTRLLVRATEWASRGEPRSLLLRGDDLADAEAILVATQGKDRAPTPTQAHFVQMSRRAATTRQRSAIAMALCVALVASTLGLVALRQRNEASAQRAAAERNASESRSRALAAASVGRLDADPELSLLLSLEAMETSRTTEAVGSLRQAVTESRVRATLRGFDMPVEVVAFSPEGTAVVAAAADGTARIWTPGSSTDPIDLVGHTDLIDAAAFSPDGSLVVTASFDGTARVWDAASGEPVATLTGHEDAVEDAAFSPDGTLVATAGQDGTARIWDARTGEPIRTLEGHTRPVYDVSYSPDGTRIVTASDDDTARIWDVDSGRVLHVLEGHADGLYTAAFDPDGRRVVTSSQDGTAKVWDVSTGALVSDLGGHRGAVVSASFSPNGRSVVTASEDKTARVWDAAIGRQLQVLRGHEDQLNSAAFSSDGRFVVTTSRDGTARVWNATDAASVAVLRGHEGPVLTADFSPGGDHVVTGGQDGTVRDWEPVSEATLYEGSSSWSAADPATRIVAISGFDGSVTATSTARQRQLWSTDVGVSQTTVAVSPDAKLVVSGGTDGVGHVFVAATGRQIQELHGHDRGYFSAEFNARDDRVLTWSDDGTARLWDPRSGEQLAMFDQGGNIWEAHLSADGSRVLTTGLATGVVKVWDVATGEELWSRSDLLGPATIGGAIAPDGSMVGTVASQAEIWDAVSGEKLATLKDPDSIHGLAFSSDGTTALTRSNDGGARLWDPRTGRLIVDMHGPTEVMGVAFSRDDRWVVTGDKDDVFRVWDPRTGEAVATFHGAGGEGIYGLSADGGRSVVSFSADGVLLHRCDACATSDQLLKLAASRVTRDLTPAERATYISATPATPSLAPRPAGLTDANGEDVPDGALAPGTYGTVGFDPELSFTVGDQWFMQTFGNRYTPPEIGLGRVVELIRADDPSNGVNILRMNPGRFLDGEKAWDERRNVQPFPQHLAAWFDDHPNLKVVQRGSMAVDGIDAPFVDTLGTSIPEEAPFPNCSCVALVATSLSNTRGPVGSNDSLVPSTIGGIDRWIVIRSGGQTILIDAFAATRRGFEKFLPVVGDLVTSMTLKG